MKLPATITFRQMLARIWEDFHVHQRDWTLPGFRAMAVYRFGVWAGGLRRFGPLKAMLLRIHRAFYRYVRNHYGIEIERTAQLGRRVEIGHQSGIVIHCFSTVGDGCIIRQNVTLGAVNARTWQQGPTLGNRVDVGVGAVIIGDVKIGDDVRIGPNCAVTMDVPCGATVFGNPMRIMPPASAPVDSGPGKVKKAGISPPAAKTLQAPEPFTGRIVDHGRQICLLAAYLVEWQFDNLWNLLSPLASLAFL